MKYAPAVKMKHASVCRVKYAPAGRFTYEAVAIVKSANINTMKCANYQ